MSDEYFFFSLQSMVIKFDLSISSIINSKTFNAKPKLILHHMCKVWKIAPYIKFSFKEANPSYLGAIINKCYKTFCSWNIRNVIWIYLLEWIIVNGDKSCMNCRNDNLWCFAYSHISQWNCSTSWFSNKDGNMFLRVFKEIVSQ